MMVKDWIARWATYTPQKVCLYEYETDRQLSYAQLNRWANYLAHLLTVGHGLQKGDRLMVLAEHGLEYVALMVACQKTGLILVPVNYRLAGPEIDYLISDARPALLITETKFQAKVAKTKHPVEQWSLDSLQAQLSDCPETEFVAAALADEHPLFILYTSGTTGFPKGAIYTHQMLFWNSVNTTQSLELSPADHTITFMPAFHTGGWNVLLTPLLHRGGSVGILKRFDADLVLRLVERSQPQLLMAVPTMLKLLSESPGFSSLRLTGLRYLIVGGEALPLEVIRTWHAKGIKIRQGYGLTEVGPNITSLHQDDAERKIGSIGRPNFYVEAQVLDGANQPVAAGEIGELCLRGPMMTPGYWQKPEATAAAIMDGWFHTGDLVRCDAEGYYYVVDRKKSMFISGGENVYPSEVERVLRLLPAVNEVAVVGVPDPKWGEVGKALISLRPGTAWSEEQLHTHCLEHLAKFKVPRYFKQLAALPKNDSGKLDRKQLAQL